MSAVQYLALMLLVAAAAAIAFAVSVQTLPLPWRPRAEWAAYAVCFPLALYIDMRPQGPAHGVSTFLFLVLPALLFYLCARFALTRFGPFAK